LIRASVAVTHSFSADNDLEGDTYGFSLLYYTNVYMVHSPALNSRLASKFKTLKKCLNCIWKWEKKCL